jgi:16S rRNA (cytidine1402-2'-O)-methyltransferase
VSVAEGKGTLYIVATPIGNLDDMSPRAERVLREATLIACEDTRHTRKLCARFDIPTRRVSLHAHNEARRVPGLLERLARGESIALVSDAGTPLLSDPGARLVSAALDAGFEVTAVPGPSAILTALVSSGLPVQPFTFLGFPPRKGTARRRWLETAAAAPGTLVLFESPQRVRDTLRHLHEALGPRRVAVARELTKRFEEVRRGTLGEIELDEPRGELTIVVEGGPAEKREEGIEERLVEEVRARRLPIAEAARQLSRSTGEPRSEVYRRLLRLVR